MTSGLSGVPAITFNGGFLFHEIDSVIKGSKGISFTQIVPITELIHIALQVFTAYTMELTKYTPLQKCPEAFNRVGVNISFHIPVLMLDNGVR